MANIFGIPIVGIPIESIIRPLPILGTPGNDTLSGTILNDTLVGFEGDDLLLGGSGDDLLDGGFGFDTLDGGAGTDTTTYAFYSGPISANLETGVVGFPGNTTLTDKLISIENLIGTQGNDTILGSSVNNVLDGGAGNDSIDGGAGDDKLYGGLGDDFLNGGFGFDTLDGGAGTDTTTYAFYNGSISANLETGVVSFPGNSTLTDKLISIENLIGGQGNDTIVGSTVNNVLDGGAGNDSIDGGAGSDTLTGGLGADVFKFASSSHGIDKISDFNFGQGDKVQIAASGFQLTSSADINSFSYNQSTGAIAFKGNQLAVLQPNTDFVVSRDLVLDGLPARKTVTIDNLTFNTNGQSIWNTGQAFTFQDNRFLGASWNTSGSKTIVNERKFLGQTIIPKVGVSGSTSGKVGLQSNLTVQSGTVNANLPIDISIDLPNSVKAGQTVTIKSNFNVDPTATFSTLSPNAQYNLDLIFGFNANAKFQVGGSNKNLFNVNVPQKQLNILKLDAQKITPTIDIPGGYGSFGLKIPNLNTTGTLGRDLKTLSGTKSDSFFNANIDLDRIATSVLQKVGVPVPNLSGSVSANLGPFGGSFSYDLADLRLLGNLTLQQKFDLVANNLKGTITLSNAAKTKLDFTLGQDLTFTVPNDIVGGKLDLSASVNLGANLKNTTTLGGNVSLDFSALSASVSGSILGVDVASAGFGPLYHQNFPIASGNIADIYNNTFALSGFNTQTFNAGSITVI